MKRIVAAAMLGCASVVFLPAAQSAEPDGFHWAGTGDRSVKLIDSLSRRFDGALAGAVRDWNVSRVVTLKTSPGSDSRATRKACEAPHMGIRICNGDYGSSWAGSAAVKVEGRHITGAALRVDTSNHSDLDEIRTTICHELGHALGLEHRDQSDPTCLTPYISRNLSPDVIDIRDLALTYGHTDAIGHTGGLP